MRSVYIKYPGYRDVAWHITVSMLHTYFNYVFIIIPHYHQHTGTDRIVQLENGQIQNSHVNNYIGCR
jgi:hypothetical protein